jgi:hypothetical protein
MVWRDCFGDITGGGTLFGKARLIRRVLAEQGLGIQPQ